MNDPLLTFEHVTFQYPNGRKAALRDLSLIIESGTATAILGSNGAGKTTLLHLALGWLRPQKGRVLLNGQPLYSFSRRDLGRRMALVPQSERIPFEYSVLEYVLLGRAPFLSSLEMPGRQDCRIALAALEQVGLGELAGRSITTLSGGERQLALVARALAQEPALLLLDEPTAHLDLANKARLVNLLRKLAAGGITLLLTTHEPEVASALATHLILMRAGQVQHAGQVAEVFTTEHLSATYGAPVRVTAVEGQTVVLWDHSRSC